MPRGVYKREPWMGNVKIKPAVRMAVLAAIASGQSIEQIRQQFQIGRITITRWRADARKSR